MFNQFLVCVFVIRQLQLPNSISKCEGSSSFQSIRASINIALIPSIQTIPFALLNSNEAIHVHTAAEISVFSVESLNVENAQNIKHKHMKNTKPICSQYVKRKFFGYFYLQ